MMVNGKVKEERMPDWYSEFLLSRARQLEIACMAEGRRRLVGNGLRGDKPRSPQRTLRNQLASALLVLGRSLKSAGHADASGR